MQPNESIAPRRIRCAIYTRKSTEEGLEQPFNTLDAQREAGEAFILSQQQEGWWAVPDRYDDGGFSGGNMERPALRNLLRAIEAGRIDCVVVYKVDRLSRSLLDFARMMGVFDQYGVSFVSVTQQFNTRAPVGRLTLNILLSFAQFEREIISDRTRDKLSAARQRGKWTGGYLMLGYDLDPQKGKLILNRDEACQVRAIYRLFAKYGDVSVTLMELERRGWKTKTWVTQEGKLRCSLPFTEGSLLRLLTNPTYRGLIRHRMKLYPGEHAAIVDRGLSDKVQELIGKGVHIKKKLPGNKHGALLKGLLHCERCDTPMAYTYASARGQRYHYYVCRNQSGGTVCRQRVSASVLELSVLSRIESLVKQMGSELKPSGNPPDVHSLKKEDQLRLIESVIEKVTLDSTTGRIKIRLRREIHA